MALPIHISCPAPIGQGGLGYHMHFISRAYLEAGIGDTHIYCLTGGGGDHVQAIKFEPIWMFLQRYSPMRWIPSVINNVNQSHFDREVARGLPLQSIMLHAFPGAAEESFHQVRRRGGTTILEAATTHVTDMVREVSLEHHMHRMGGSPFSKKWETRVLAEYDLADFITVSSQLQKESLIQHGIPDDKIIFAPLGIDCNEFHPLTEQPSVQPRQEGQKFRIVQVGQVSLLKGFQYTLKALEIIDDPDIELILFGGIGWRGIRQHVESYARRGFKVRNEFGDPRPWLRSAHVCVHPSISDGFGLAPLEAMATGLPTIVTNQTGMKDAIEDGKSGYVVPSRDANALAERIYQLKCNDSLRISMGREARKSALMYDVHICGKRYANTLSTVWNA